MLPFAVSGTHKHCNRCRLLLPATTEFFHRNAKKLDGLMGLCKACRSGVVGDGNRRRRERQVESAGRVPGRCDVCGTKMRAGRGTNSAHWDHNHGTGDFRGWLCNGCNRALGCAGDSPEILERLAAYLRKHGYSETRTPSVGADVLVVDSTYDHDITSQTVIEVYHRSARQ